MLHVATVHWRDDRWIEPQRRYLERHVEQPFRIWADLEGVEAPPGAFHHVQDLAATKTFENGIFSHTEKLNALATTSNGAASHPTRSPAPAGLRLPRSLKP